MKCVSDLRHSGRLFFPGTPVSSTNKTDRHNITEILLKEALNTTTPDLIMRTMVIFFSLSYPIKQKLYNYINNLNLGGRNTGELGI
jgi:hypothetical protein